MTEREEFEKWREQWTGLYPERMPTWFDIFQAGRRSRQRQDAELCDAGGCPECRKDIEGTP